MSEYLEKTCVSLGIRLVYTYNKSTVLSVEINKEKPLLIADMMFKNCPDSVSQAIIGFFTDINNKSSHEKIIKNFVEDYFKPLRPGNIKYFDLSYLVKQTQKKNADYNNKFENHDYKAELKNIDKKIKPKDNTCNINFDMNNIDISKIDFNDPNLVEVDIYNINGKDFWGSEKQYKANSSIKPIKNDELQLNIVILPPDT